jgi:glycosyltransferase involved in cell wall biosynthesis
MPLSCSIVIPTFHRPEQLNRCLAAATKQDYGDFDLLVIDNSCGDPRTEAVARAWNVRYVTEEQQGLCRARNRAATESTADVIAYLDDDSVPESGWLRAIAKEFEDPLVMAVGGRTIPISLDTEAERLYARVRGAAYQRPSRLVVDRNTPAWFEICAFGGIGAGCNMAIRRSAFDVWPGFHERTDRGTPVHGGGEQHAFVSLASRGFRVSHTPDAVVRHPYPPSMEVLRHRYLKELTASTAFFTMMLVEEKGLRRATLRYLFEGLRGKKRAWRGEPSPGAPRVVSRSRKAFALLLGPFQYIRGVVSPKTG